MNLFRAVYALSFNTVLFASACLILACLFVNYTSEKAAVKRGVNYLGCALSVFAILAFTLLSRTEKSGMILEPFQFLERAKKQPELYRSFFMNVFLFVPLGAFLPYALSNKPHLRNVLITVAVGCLLSACVEILQYLLSRGLSETDDVIANTLGTVFGAASYCLYLYAMKSWEVSAINRKLNSEQKLLLDLVAEAYFGKTAVLPQAPDAEALTALAHEQTVFPALYLMLQKHFPTDPAVGKQFSRHIASYTTVESAHIEIGDLLQKNGIAYVVIKGVASASYYKEPILRAMGDIDILVEEHDIPKADALLQSIGYATKDDITLPKKHFAYIRGTGKRGIVCELHRGINGVLPEENRATAEKYMANILAEAQTVETECGECFVPSDFHHGLILLLHTARHLIKEGVGLRHLCDWAFFVDRFSNDRFLEIFETPLKEIGIWRFAQLLTLCCVRYLGCAPKAWAGTADEALLEGIVCDIMAGGNFGFNDRDRYRQIKYLTDRGKNTVSKSNSLWQACRSIHAKTKQEHPFFREHPVFLPAGWVLTVCDYIGLVLMGKRESDSLKTVKTAQERRKLYDEFALFQTGGDQGTERKE